MPGVLIPFAPRLIPVILSALAHHVPEIQQAAADTNEQLYAVVQSLPVDGQPALPPNGSSLPVSPTAPSVVAVLYPPATAPTTAGANDRVSPIATAHSSIPFPTSGTPRPGHDRSKAGSDGAPLSLTSLSLAPTASPSASARGAPAYPADLQDEYEPDGSKFQYGATVNELTLLFLSDNEETRVAALEWLLMLHQKAPRKVRLIPYVCRGAEVATSES